MAKAKTASKRKTASKPKTVKGNKKRKAKAPKVIKHPAPGVMTDEHRRDDSDVIPGRPAVITKGDHKGRQGLIVDIATTDKNGYPKDVVFSFRRSPNERISIDYEDVDPLPEGFGAV